MDRRNNPYAPGAGLQPPELAGRDRLIEDVNRAPTSPIARTAVAEATPDVIAHLDANFFRVRFDRLTVLQQKYLRAMAELGPGPHKTGDIAATLGVGAASVATSPSGNNS